MINRATVFILGAGASIPYKYPSGKELVEEILEELLNRKMLFKLCVLMEFKEHDINKFAKALRCSGDSSIDAFLERNDEFIDLGKVVIHLTLVKREKTIELFSVGDEKWYGDLVNELKTPTCEAFKDNKVSFLTFNYDRSFDHYLFTSVKHAYGIKGDGECRRIVNSIPIIHLHGQIGKLPWQVNNENIESGREYDSGYRSLRILKDVASLKTGSELREAISDIRRESKQIKIIHEKELDGDEGFKKAHTLLINAERIYFLGFGYNDENLRRLNIIELSDEIEQMLPTGRSVGRRIIDGTSYGIGQAKKTHISSITRNKIKLSKTEDYKVLKFIKEKVEFD